MTKRFVNTFSSEIEKQRYTEETSYNEIMNRSKLDQYRERESSERAFYPGMGILSTASTILEKRLVT